MADSKDAATGLPVWSLHDNGRNRMTPKMLRRRRHPGLRHSGRRRALLHLFLHACSTRWKKPAKTHRPIYVLDRPNPVTGVHVEGPLLDSDLQSFVGCYAMPIRHGLTFGELATMANAERKLNADLHVIKMKNWSRGDWFDSTDLTWTDPSPNMRSLNAATSIRRRRDARIREESFRRPRHRCALRADRRGLDSRRGAGPIPEHPVDSRRARLSRRVSNPTSSNFKGKTIEGVRFVILNRDQFNAVRLGPGTRLRASKTLSRQNRFRILPTPDRKSQNHRRDEIRRRSTFHRTGSRPRRSIVPRPPARVPAVS